MNKFKIALINKSFANTDIEREEVENAGGELVVVESMKPAEEDVINAVKDADAVVVVFSSITENIINATEKCKVIVRTGIGFDNIDVNAATKKGIPVANVPDYCFDEVSDHAVSLALALARQVVTLNTRVKNRNWSIDGVPILAMQGQTFGLVGFGNIPRHVAEKVKVFGFNVIAYDPFVDAKTAEALGVKMVDLPTLFKESDIVSVHAPLMESTRHMVSADMLKLMKPTAYIVNTARGPLIDEAALYTALKEKWIAGAGIDVTEEEPPKMDNPLFDLDNIIITPHAAFASDKAIPSLRRKSMQEAIRCALGERPKNWVNRRAMESK